MNISWIIERLLVKPTEGDKTDVVITADWRCNGSQDQVLGWCFANGVNQAAIEANVTQQINDQINPPVIAPPLPWLPPVVVAPEAPVVEAPAV